jgi:hypothetical protein
MVERLTCILHTSGPKATLDNGRTNNERRNTVRFLQTKSLIWMIEMDTKLHEGPPADVDVGQHANCDFKKQIRNRVLK